MKRSCGARSCRELSHVVCWSSTCKWCRIGPLCALGLSAAISEHKPLKLWDCGKAQPRCNPVLVPFQPFYYLVVSYFISLPCPQFRGTPGCSLVLPLCYCSRDLVHTSGLKRFTCSLSVLICKVTNTEVPQCYRKSPLFLFLSLNLGFGAHC